MFANAKNILPVRGDICLLGIGALFSWAVVLAQSNDRVRLTPSNGDLLREEIIESSGDWRQPPQSEYQWRQPQMEEQSRIKLGFDSTYEATRARQEPLNTQSKFRDPKPSTLFRLSY